MRFLAPAFVRTPLTRFGFVALVTASIAGASGTGGVLCIDRLDIPPYPLLGVQAQVTGTVKAEVLLDQSSTASDIRIESRDTGGLLPNHVRSLLQAAKYSRQCASATVRLVFHFELKGPATDRPKTSFAFTAPNEFWVISRPQQINPVSSKRERPRGVD